MIFQTPAALKAEHDALHQDLSSATKAGGRTGEAAKEVARLMHPHFLKEEEFALPPLGLLPALSQGRVEPAMAAILALTDRLERELPQMLAEHKEITAALHRLSVAAEEEGKPDQLRFAQGLMAHARSEEEIAYPTALLIGRYVRAMLSEGRAKVA